MNKTLDIPKEHFHWPRMGEDVHRVVFRCSICHIAKSQFHQVLYAPLSIPLRPWEDISVDFVVALPRTQRGKDSIMVVVDRFTNMTHFVACHKADDASHIVELYLREIIRLHGIPKTIVSDRTFSFCLFFGEAYVIYWVPSSSIAQSAILKLMAKLKSPIEPCPPS